MWGSVRFILLVPLLLSIGNPGGVSTEPDIKASVGTLNWSETGDLGTAVLIVANYNPAGPLNLDGGFQVIGPRGWNEDRQVNHMTRFSCLRFGRQFVAWIIVPEAKPIEGQYVIQSRPGSSAHVSTTVELRKIDVLARPVFLKAQLLSADTVEARWLPSSGAASYGVILTRTQLPRTPSYSQLSLVRETQTVISRQPAAVREWIQIFAFSEDLTSLPALRAQFRVSWAISATVSP